MLEGEFLNGVEFHMIDHLCKDHN